MENLSAAIAKIPDRELEIRALAAFDDSFRTLCADLSDAVQALDHWHSVASVDLPERIAEYDALIEALVAEMRATLDEAPGRAPTGTVAI